MISPVMLKLAAMAGTIFLGVALTSCEPSGGNGYYVFDFNAVDPLNGT